MKKLLRQIRDSQNLGPVLLAIIVGLAGGVGAVVFRYLISGIDGLFFQHGQAALGFLGEYAVIFFPALGMLIVGLVVRRWAPEAQGHGVPEVMYAVKKEGGRIRPRVAVIKALASALCIGSGGSVGREGPIVQIGCSLGSSLGQLLRLSEEQIKLLVACGAAAAIGGTFNAPIAGVLFALEVILGSFGARSFGLVVISSVASTALCRAVLGDQPAFALGAEVFALKSPLELPLYLALGVLTGVVGLVYVRTLYFFEGVFERWKWNPNLKAVAGGLVVGLIGYVGMRYLGGRHLFGVGYDGIEGALGLGKGSAAAGSLTARMTISVLLLLVALKILATSMTLSAGGSGGVFAPALYIGAMAGGAFGITVKALFPAITAPAGAYALVGMAALFAGAAHAPITSILILFEMTDDYKIILPLMLAVVVSHLIASTLSPDSIYTIKLRRRGGLAPAKSEVSVLDVILVTDAMTTEVETIRPDVPLVELAVQFHAGHVRSLPVLDTDEKLVGIVTEYDVETAVMNHDVAGHVAGDIMTRELITCTPDQTLREVVQYFTQHDVGRLPVVNKDDPQKLLGVLRRQEIFWAYGEMATEHRRLLIKTGMSLPTDQKDSVQTEIEVRPEHTRLCFRKLRHVQMPEQCLIVILRRADQAIVPRGDTVIEPGDVLVALTTRDHEARLRHWIAHLTEA